MDNEIVFKTASELVDGVTNKTFSVSEVMKAHLDRIDRTNQKVNAIVSLNKEKAMKEAVDADNLLAKDSDQAGILFGLPTAIKDTNNAKGFPTTKGSEIFADSIAQTDHVIAERMKNAGTIVIGKTNVPEFAAGSHTYNNVFGTTKNPYDVSKTAGGSSGGAAAALASGMIPIADGSDMGGSCRNPAAYNNVVGLRPTPGVIPIYPMPSLYSTLTVQGPLARNTKDVALMLSAVAGYTKKDPLSSKFMFENITNNLEIETKGLKVAYSHNLGGAVPISTSVQSAFEKQLSVFTDLGCEIENASPSFTNAGEIFRTLRALQYVISHKEVYTKHKEKLKSSVVWNIEKGLELSTEDISRAKNLQADLFQRVRVFFEEYDFLILPVSQVQPFDITTEYPHEINGKKMTSYIEWMESCSHITVTGCPAISVPGGFCEDGLPFGLQIVAPFNMDGRLLQIAYAFEQATQYNRIKPII